MSTIERHHTQPPEPLTFDAVRAANVSRGKAWHGDTRPWGLVDWGNALAGEVGEACNLIKKLQRIADGISNPNEVINELSPDAMLEELADELADVALQLDLLAACARVDLGAAVRRKFNRKSEKLGFPERL